MSPGSKKPAASDLTSTRPEGCPVPPPGFSGVLAAAPAQSSSRSPLLIHGAFQLAEAEAARIDEHLHRALVVGATVPGSARVFTPFRTRALFEDDVQRVGGMRRGFFTVDVNAHRKMEPGYWYLHASLGTCISEICRVRII